MDNQSMGTMIIQAINESHEDLLNRMNEVHGELTQKIEGVRTELKQEIQDVRTELKQEMNDRFGEVHARFDTIDEDMDYVKHKIHEHDKDIFTLKNKLKNIQ